MLPPAKGPVVYARTSTIQADPATIDEGVAYVRDEILPVVTSMDGCVGMSMLVNRGSGRCIATTAWESEQAMQASAEKVLPLRIAAEQALAASTSEVEIWEVQVVHRDQATLEGAGARVTRLSGDARTIDRAVDMFKMVVLPKVQEFHGFCSASLLTNRDAGRVAGTIIYNSVEELETTREATDRLREMVSQELGATVDEVAEMEVAFAHLHIPELA